MHRYKTYTETNMRNDGEWIGEGRRQINNRKKHAGGYKCPYLACEVEDDLGGLEGEGEREELEGWLHEAEAALLPMRMTTQDQGEARGGRRYVEALLAPPRAFACRSIAVEGEAPATPPA
jgi:hypothetical protein